MLTKEMVEIWRSNDVTKEIMKLAEEERQDAMRHLANGETLIDVGEAVRDTANVCGFIAGLTWLLDIEGDEDE